MNHCIEPENDYDGEIAVNSCAGHGGFVNLVFEDGTRYQWSLVTPFIHIHSFSVPATSPRNRFPCSNAFEHSITKAITDLLQNQAPLQASSAISAQHWNPFHFKFHKLRRAANRLASLRSIHVYVILTDQAIR